MSVVLVSTITQCDKVRLFPRLRRRLPIISTLLYQRVFVTPPPPAALNLSPNRIAQSFKWYVEIMRAGLFSE